MREVAAIKGEGPWLFTRLWLPSPIRAGGAFSGACMPAWKLTTPANIRALAGAHRGKRMLEVGRVRLAGESAEAEGVTRSFVSRLLRLTLLVPDIVQAILDGRQAEGDAAGGIDKGDAEGVGGANYGSLRLPPEGAEQVMRSWRKNCEPRAAGRL